MGDHRLFSILVFLCAYVVRPVYGAICADECDLKLCLSASARRVDYAVGGLRLWCGFCVGVILPHGDFAAPLLDKEVDFVTAMLKSIAVVKANPKVMLIWGALIASLTVLAMLPALLGLFLVLPVLGHASWHIYRRAFVHEAI